MNLLQFIRLVLRNITIVVLVPVVIAITVFIFSRNNPDNYKSNSTVYTGFASGFSIENGEKNKIDFHAINIAFDNLMNIVKARETKEEVALRLLAHHIFLNKKADKTVLQSNIDRLNEIIPSDIIYKVLDKKSEENTFNNLLLLKNQDEKNVIYTLLNDENEPYYSVFAIDDIRVTRMESSDMVRLEFESKDPGICQNVLNIVSATFIKRFRRIKQGETSNDSEFFEVQSKQALGRLNTAEEKLKNFRSQNRVINYYEQTKFISEKREDLIDELNKERMVLAGSEAALKNVEDKLGASKQLLKASSEVLKLRNEIIDLNTKILLLQNDEGTGNLEEINKLNLELNKLKNQLDDKVVTLFGSSVSKEGINHKELASIWIDNAVRADESNARMPFYNKRLNEIESTYDQFAPLGSNLNKMEREIGIAEKEYLSHIASLNAARLREQNLVMSSNLQIVDPAFFPIKPQPNNKKLLILGGAAVGLILVIAILIMLELIDQTIKSPDRAAKLIGKQIIGGLPLMNKKTVFLEENGTVERMVGMLNSRIYQSKRQKLEKEKPFIVSMVSTRSSTGKTYIAGKIYHHFIAAGKKVLLILPETVEHKINGDLDVVYYKKGIDYLELETINQLFPSGKTQIDYDIVLVEYLPFFEQKPPVGLVTESDLCLLVANSESLWEDSDKLALTSFEEVYTKPIYVVLNKLIWFQLEAFIGEVPQKRSKIRQLIKKWIKLDFSK